MSSGIRALLAVVGLCFLCVASSADDALEEVELFPNERAGWRPADLFSPVASLFNGGPSHWYSQRRIEIRTTPPGAAVDLFYVRRNFQKGYEQADAPCVVVLPSPAEAGPRDSLKVRAFADGYQQKEVTVAIRSRESNLVIDLEPLANTLVGVGHVYFADRSSFAFLTKEAVTFRMQDRGEGQYSLILLQTALSPEAEAAMQGVGDSLVQRLRPQQLGTDLVIQLELTERAVAQDVDLRQRQSYDAVRRSHRFTLDVMPKGGGVEAVRRAKAALARIGRGAIDACALRFDEVLHERLDRARLASALAPQARFTDPYLREALRRLGELSPDGAVELGDGSRFRTSIPLELAAASSQAAEVVGYLALLDRFVAGMEPGAHRDETLRGLIAPESDPAEFARALADARAAEASCR